MTTSPTVTTLAATSLLPLLLLLLLSSARASLARATTLCSGSVAGPCGASEKERPQCTLHLSHHWTAKAESSVYASLLAAPLFPERGGHGPQVLAATLSGYVELIDGDGARPKGWPVSFQERNFRSAPLLYDIDADNRVDVLVGDRDGKVLFAHVGDSGQYLADQEVELPALVERGAGNWVFEDTGGERTARQKTGRTVDSIGTVEGVSESEEPGEWEGLGRHEDHLLADRKAPSTVARMLVARARCISRGVDRVATLQQTHNITQSRSVLADASRAGPLRDPAVPEPRGDQGASS